LENIRVKRLETMEELYEMQELEKAVWQGTPVPVHHTFTVMKNGGILLGAYEGKRMVGFLYSFPGISKEWGNYLCSHMMGFLPEYRRKGIGERLKRMQRELAEEAGFSRITWTFDPLESVNAYLNLHKLGAIAARYDVNYYGIMNDGINRGLPTDRFHAVWDLKETSGRKPADFDEKKVLLDATDCGKPISTGSKERIWEGDGPWFVAVPANIQQLKQDDFSLVLEWRRHTRAVFVQLFQAGFVASDFIRDPSGTMGYYVLTKAGEGENGGIADQKN
jgi:Acetyltransferase (GNAT) family.